MNAKTVRILYWTLTCLFALFTLGDAFGGITKQQAGIDVLKHLGYPDYIMPFLGVAKLLGVAAILQQKLQTIKEWAYGGFAFNFIGAFVSRAVLGDAAGMLLIPLVALAIMFASYFLWRQMKGNELDISFEKRTILWKQMKF